MLRKEFLREGEGEWGCQPRHLHDGHETHIPCRLDLMVGAGASDDCHAAQVDSVLDWCNL